MLQLEPSSTKIKYIQSESSNSLSYGILESKEAKNLTFKYYEAIAKRNSYEVEKTNYEKEKENLETTISNLEAEM